MPTKKDTRKKRLDFTVTAELYRDIQQAAKIKGQTVKRFMEETIPAEAARYLAQKSGQ